MTEIKFKLVDGEPVCDAWKDGVFRCGATHCAYYTYRIPGKDPPCIPGWRQQRDDRTKERDEAREQLAEARAVIGRVREMVDSTLARPIGEFSVFTSPKDFARQVDALLLAPICKRCNGSGLELPILGGPAEWCTQCHGSGWCGPTFAGHPVIRDRPATEKSTTGLLPPTSLADAKIEKTRERVRADLRRHGLIAPATEGEE